MKKVRVMLMMAMVAMLSVCFSSCDDDEFTDSVVGVWELESDEIDFVAEYMVDKYRFNPDGSGVYGCYDRYGNWLSDIPFVWDYGWDGRNTICIDFGADGGVYYYYYERHGVYLTLSEDPSFRTWLQYCRVAN
ncbi:MAG: hypothetical protein ACI308_11080 [Muribaculaceae bacterium]